MHVTPIDMDREDIVAAIRKRGLSCAALAKHHGFSRGAISVALIKAWPAVEQIVARHLDRPPESIWPSRYDAAGKPLSGGWTYLNRRSGSAKRQNREAA